MRRLTIVVGLVMLAAVAFGCGQNTEDSPCGLEPSGDITDGTFSGSFDFGGANSFPLKVTYTAEGRTLTGTLQFQDINETFTGTFNAQIDFDGKVTGTSHAVGNSSKQSIQIAISGEANDEEACGYWSNQFDQEGTWYVARTGGGPVDDVFNDLQPVPQDDVIAQPEDATAPPEDVSAPPEDIAGPPEEIAAPPEEVAAPPEDIPAAPEDIGVQEPDIAPIPEDVGVEGDWW